MGIRLRVDGLSLFFGALCAGVLAAAVVHESGPRVETRLFPGLVLLLGAGLHGAFATGDLFNFYVFFELSVVTSFVLAAYGRGRAEIRGTLVYVTVNLIGSVLFLAAIAAVYRSTGVLDLEQIAARQHAQASLVLPAALIFAALSVKLGLFPFHSWVPVLYSHARPAVAAALSGALVNIGAYGLLRLGYVSLSSARQDAAPFLVALGAAAGLYGGVLALRRASAAEIGAYNAVVHSGYIVLALGVGGVHGVGALLFTVLSGSIDKATMFFSLDGRGEVRRTTALVAAASVAGLPLTLGLISKVRIFRAALEAPAPGAVVTVVAVSALLVLAAAFRYWRLASDERASSHHVAAAVVLSAVTVVLGAWPEPVARLVARLTSVTLGAET